MSLSWQIVTATIGWTSYIAAGLLLKVKGMDYKGYKYIMGYGYLLFFAYIAWTALDQVSYIFVLPLISVLALYKDKKYIKNMMITTLFILFTSNLYKGCVKGMMEFVSSIDCAIQFAIVICCYACALMSIKHLLESDGALTGSIKSNLERVVKTVEQVKDASNSIVDGVTVVREFVVGLIGASVEHANISSEELVEVVDTTNKMAELSKQVEKILEEFKEVFDNVKEETGSINDAEETTQTMLSKYDESARSAVSIETVVGHLMEELGVGGFMGVQDVKAGMKIAVVFKNATSSKKSEYIGEVVDRDEHNVYVQIENRGQDIIDKRDKHALCQLRIVVDNVLYYWEETEILISKDNEKGNYCLIIDKNPRVFNRRKYPRMPQDSEAIKEYVGKNYSE